MCFLSKNRCLLNLYFQLEVLTRAPAFHRIWWYDSRLLHCHGKTKHKSAVYFFLCHLSNGDIIHNRNNLYKNVDEGAVHRGCMQPMQCRLLVWNVLPTATGYFPELVWLLQECTFFGQSKYFLYLCNKKNKSCVYKMYSLFLDGFTLAVAHLLIIIICDCNRFTPMTHHRPSQGWWYQTPT